MITIKREQMFGSDGSFPLTGGKKAENRRPPQPSPPLGGEGGEILGGVFSLNMPVLRTLRGGCAHERLDKGNLANVS